MRNRTPKLVANTLKPRSNLLVGPSVTKSFTTHAEIENHGIWTKLAARFDPWGSKEAGLPVRESCLKRRAARQNQSQRSQACRTDCFFRLAARQTGGLVCDEPPVAAISSSLHSFNSAVRSTIGIYLDSRISLDSQQISGTGRDSTFRRLSQVLQATPDRTPWPEDPSIRSAARSSFPSGLPPPRRYASIALTSWTLIIA